MIKNLEGRLEALERYLHRGKPGLRITYNDGTEIIVPAGKAICIVKEQAPDIAKVESVEGRNGLLPDLLADLCGGDDEE